MDFLSIFKRKKTIPPAKSQFEICCDLCEELGQATLNDYGNQEIAESTAALIMKTINEVKIDLANIKNITIVELHRLLKDYENVRIPYAIGKSNRAYDVLYCAKNTIQWELYHRLKI